MSAQFCPFEDTLLSKHCPLTESGVIFSKEQRCVFYDSCLKELDECIDSLQKAKQRCSKN